MQFGTQQPSKRLISLTPLIDVVFILLVFFMLASSFLDWRQIDLSVSSGTGAAAAARQSLVIDLKSDGTIVIGSGPVSMRNLQATITGKLGDDQGQSVVIRAASGVPLQRAVNILDVVRTAGATNVSLARNR